VTPDARQEFVVRLAASYHNKTGSLGELSTALGGSKTMLHMLLKSPGGLNAMTCIKIEECLGRDLFPREFLRPDIFVAE
jgi:hypothetical protein